MAKSDRYHNSANKIKVAECLRFGKTYQVTVGSAAKDLETLLGEALPDYAAGVEIVPDGAINVQCNGDAADADSAKIRTGFPRQIPGFKDQLDDISLYAASDTSVAIFVIQTDTSNDA